ncbi:hypothetical protein Tco_1015048 [Tanacetum coccineum]|uniref:Uncharacterized protein n=1 Tax=Tanacetum coccineum TaxID=301880 RepID=A0ABQ5FJP6_9ASTR
MSRTNPQAAIVSEEQLMPPQVTNKPYTKPPTEKELLAFIKTLVFLDDLADMHSEEHDLLLSKLINTIDGEFKFGIEIPDTMINDAIKEPAGYKYYKIKKDQSKEDNAEKEPEEQNVNVSSKPNKTVIPRKQRTITVADNIVEQEIVAVELAKSVSIVEQRL